MPPRRVQPIEALNPYQSAWTIRVRAAGKGALRTVKTARGEVSVFSVELTDEQVCRTRRFCAPFALTRFLACEGHHHSGDSLARGG